MLEEAVRLLSSRAAEDADNTDTQLAFAYALAALARLEREGDHLDAAFDLQKRALEVRQAVSRYPATDAAVADSLNSLSLISQQRGDLKSAIAFARDGLAISEKISPKSAISKRINLAAALRSRGYGGGSGARDGSVPLQWPRGSSRPSLPRYSFSAAVHHAWQLPKRDATAERELLDRGVRQARSKMSRNRDTALEGRFPSP